MTGLPWVYDDGGRRAAGYKGLVRDCVTRAIAIAGELPYQEVYDLVNAAGNAEPSTRRYKRGDGTWGTAIRMRRSAARTGVLKKTSRQILTDLGWKWTPLMGIGTGCKVHLAEGELPTEGRLILKLSKHLCAVIDGVVHDTGDPSRGGTRCVYGYWTKKES